VSAGEGRLAGVPDDGGLAAALALAGARGTLGAGSVLPGEAELVALLPGAGALSAVRVSGPRRWWDGPLDVEGLALGSTRLAAAALARLIGRPGALSLRSERVAAAFDSFRLLRVGGEAVQGFAPLSRFWPCADGWLRTHANYPHHRARLLAALGVAEAAGPEAVGAALARLTVAEAEHRIVERGGIAAAVRTRTAWATSAAGVAASRFAPAPLSLGPTAPTAPTAPKRPDADRAAGEPGERPRRPAFGPPSRGPVRVPWRPNDRHARAPLSGLRVLDLSRVIAGPTASRTLAALGADVLRLDPPGLPELREQFLDTDTGKRRANADLRAEATRVHTLLAGAHVVITGYRPGALEALGFGPAQLAERHPHLAVASLSAWGPGPWGERRGFDSIVQAASGIAHAYRDEHGHPGALPVQALDHATGQLLVAGIASLLWTRFAPDAAAGDGAAASGTHAGDGAAADDRPGGTVTAALAHTAEALWALGELGDGPRRDTETAVRGGRAIAAPVPVRWHPEAGGPEVLAAPAALDLDGVAAAPLRWSLEPARLTWDEGLAPDTVSAPRVEA
jgi:hypothetical protein